MDSIALPSLLALSAFSGALTIAAPCILSLLPVMLGSALGQHRLRPLFIVLGLVSSFTAFGLVFATFTRFFGLNRVQFRQIAVWLIFFFGLALLFPHQYERLTVWGKALRSRLALRLRGRNSPPSPQPPRLRTGLRGAFVLGASMGLAWVPCAGPVLGVIFTIAASQESYGTAALLFAAYAVGAGVPLLVIGYGGNWIAARTRFLAGKTELVRRVAGALLAMMGLLMITEVDRKLEISAFGIFPNTVGIEERILERQMDELPMKELVDPGQKMPVLPRQP
ncbi:MAG: cytochrome c biogenesis CcdA family protein [bacterium]|nr:cytochrome c biogenesis CcdA family protein [bacterium]